MLSAGSFTTQNVKIVDKNIPQVISGHERAARVLELFHNESKNTIVEELNCATFGNQT